jgi:hypothetical protein
MGANLNPSEEALRRDAIAMFKSMIAAIPPPTKPRRMAAAH